MNRSLPLIVGIVPACVSGLMLSFSADAAEGSGWYVGGDLGFDVSTTQNFNSGGSGVQNKDNSGFIGGINGGYAFDNGLRPEVDFDYHHASVSNINVTNNQGISSPTNIVSGSLSADTLMGNLWYDFRRPDGFLSVVYPYVGAGIGLANVDLANESFNTFQGTSGSANGSKTALAYQFGFGANWDIAPNLAASLDFRYLLTSDVKIPSQETTSTSSFNGVSGIYRAPSFVLGLKYKFGGGET